MVRILVLLLALLVSCSPAEPRVPDPPPLDLDRLFRATLIVSSRDEGRPLCGAVRVSDRKIVTAFHCVAAAAIPDDQHDQVKGQGWRTLDPVGAIVGLVEFRQWRDGLDGEGIRPTPGVVVDADPFRDVAVVVAKSDNPVHVPVRFYDLRVDEPVVSVHHPVGLVYSVTRGSAANPRRTVELGEQKVEVLQLAIAWSPGSSGSGVFDRQGRLVGIAHATLGDAIGIAAPSSSFRSMLED